MVTLRLTEEELDLLKNYVPNPASMSGTAVVNSLYTLKNKILEAGHKEPWEEYVVDEVNTLLELYLPDSKTGNLGIRYSHPESARYEDGPVYDESKVNGVMISLVFEFINNLEQVQ